MDTPTPSLTPNSSTAPVMPTGNKSNKTVIVVVIAVAVVAFGYLGYQRWQDRRTAKMFLKEFGLDAKTAEKFAKDMEVMAQNLQTPEQTLPSTPAEIFAEAENFDISDTSHKELVEEIGGAVKAVFGEYKVSGYTPGYMGMNSGSGVAQFTVTKPLSLNDGAALGKELEAKGFTTTISPLDGDAVSISATKGEYAYTIGFNKDEQQIIALIIFNGNTPNTNE